MVLTTVATFFIIYQEITGMIVAQLLDAGLDHTPQNNTLLNARWAAMQLRLLLLLSGGALFILGLGSFWVFFASSRMKRPIHTIQRAVFRLAGGKLNETVTIDTADEFGQIASGINELAANLQELLLYVWKQTGKCISLLEKMETNGNPVSKQQLTKEDLARLKQLSDAIGDLREMAKAYVFYDVRLEGEQTLAISEPGNVTNPSRQNHSP